nr:MAG TPA: hypothetical protein [Caudoviricetes sp.]
MIRRLLCWLGWHKWYTMLHCGRPKDTVCFRMYCDKCPFLKCGKTICLNCEKEK